MLRFDLTDRIKPHCMFLTKTERDPIERGTIVTEFGWADLTGKTLRARAEALIELTHPKFRNELKASLRV